jgi:hypothetical protein
MVHDFNELKGVAWEARSNNLELAICSVSSFSASHSVLFTKMYDSEDSLRDEQVLQYEF